ASRRQTWWQLAKVCTFAVIGIILVMFIRRELFSFSRSVIILFGGISFLLLVAKEELIRRWLEAKVGQGQLRRRLILAGTEEDMARVRVELEQKSHQDSEIVGQLDMNETTIEQLLELVHEHSVNGIVLSARHIYFG